MLRQRQNRRMRQQILQKQIKKKLVVFDWDDTLFPTSTCIKRRHPMSLMHLDKLGKGIYALLRRYIELFGSGNIYIVTNGAKGWIRNSLTWLHCLCGGSCRWWLAILRLLDTKLSCRLISARHLHSTLHPGRSTLWKFLVFNALVEEHFDLNSKLTSRAIVIIGDSLDEHVAGEHTKNVLQSTHKLENIVLHRVKLLHSPDIESMVRQTKWMIRDATMLYQQVVQDIQLCYEEALKLRALEIACMKMNDVKMNERSDDDSDF